MSDIQEFLRSERETKQAIAWKLHQGLVQSLASLAMRAGLSRKITLQEPEKAREEIAKLESLARTIVKESRYLLYVLDPSPLAHEGLGAALVEWKQQFEALHQIEIKFQNGLDGRLDPETGRDQFIFALIVDLFEDLALRGQKEGLELVLDVGPSETIHISIAVEGRDLTERYGERVRLFSGQLSTREGAGKQIYLELSFPLRIEAGQKTRE